MTIGLSPRGLTTAVFAGVAAMMIALLSVGSSGREQPPSGSRARRAIRPERFPATGLPYSPGILVGDTLYLSGQLGRDPATARLVPGGIDVETRQALQNLRRVLNAAGMDYGDVVSVTAFITDFADFPKFNAAYAEVFGTDPPARATVQVAALNLGAHVEIQMIAARPAQRP